MVSAGSVVTQPSVVHAQDTADAELEAMPKGAIGLGLLGAELGTMIPAWAGMSQTWGYIVFPMVGAAGGALAGYYLLDSPNQTTWSVVTLAAGMAMIIPTIVISLSATAYDPDQEHTAVEVERLDDMASPDEVEAGSSGPVDEFDESRVGPSLHERVAAGSGLFRRVAGQWQLGVPGLDLQRTQTGDSERSELRFSLLSGSF